MAGQTPSELAKRGKNKAARLYLRQIGLGFLMAKGSRLALYYSVYPGNLHNSKYFEAVMDDMRHLLSVLTLKNKDRRPFRRLETPSKTQAEVLSAFNHLVDANGVLQPE